jgi:hypothetical protein
LAASPMCDKNSRNTGENYCLFFESERQVSKDISRAKHCMARLLSYADSEPHIRATPRSSEQICLKCVTGLEDYPMPSKRYQVIIKSRVCDDVSLRVVMFELGLALSRWGSCPSSTLLRIMRPLLFQPKASSHSASPP